MRQTVTYLLLSLSTYTTTAQSWTSITDFPGTERDDGIAFVIGNKAYCGTGLQVGWTPTLDMYALDMQNDSWAPVSFMPPGSERQYACGFSYQNKGFVFGGINGTNYLNDLWIYDALNNSWQAGNPMPAIGRAGASVFVIQNTAYIIGGKDASGIPLNEVWAYDCTTNLWTQKNNFPFGGRWRAVATTIANKGYFMLGLDVANTYPIQLYEYDVVNDTFLPISNFPMPGRIYASLTTFNNKLLLIAGQDATGTMHNDVWFYEPVANNWTQLTSIPSIGFRSGLCFSSANGVYYTTGLDENLVRLKTTWRANNPTFINEVTMDNAFTVFPNPVGQFLHIAVNETYDENDVTVCLFNSLGKSLLANSITTNKTQLLDLNNYPDGIYLVQLRIGSKSYHKKIIHLN